MSRRYIVCVGTTELHTPAGVVEQPLWIGLEIEGEVNLPFLSRCGYDLIPAENLTSDELASVGVDVFEPLTFPIHEEP